MSEFDKIVGYSAIKQELMLIADVLKRKDLYASLNVKAPRGLLLHGDPGLGKTLMANCLIQESGIHAFVCRKGLPDGAFVNAIKDTFNQAKTYAPSVVFLDDMDKFANEDERHKDAEEYVTVQSCIDDVKDCDVFVLATANSLENLPDSLVRAGRFDRVIELNAPHGEDAIEIIAHYMKNKPFVTSVDENLVAKLMDGSSCAELETVINEAGLYAGYDRSDVITEAHFLKACMRLVFHVPVEGLHGSGDITSTDKIHAAYHEAGHAVIMETLEPGSVALMSVFKKPCGFGGIAVRAASKESPALMSRENGILIALGGKASVESVLGVHDVGAASDLNSAFRRVRYLVKDTCIAGLRYHGGWDDSQQLQYEQEQAAAAEVEQYLRKAKMIVAENRPLLERLANELTSKDILTMFDVQRIIAEVKAAPQDIL